jgi:hypothetical protein
MPTPTVRAKFVVYSKTETGSPTDPQVSIKLHPVCSGSEENKQFYKWTPGGCIDLSTVNKAASDALILGREYYIDFTPAG